MPKEKTNKYNSLNINALPPPIGEGKESQATVLQMTGNPAQPTEKLSSYAIRLIRRLLTIADADFTDISIKDREWLEQALLGTDLNIIARHHNLTRGRIRQRINAALDLLYQKVEAWEVSQNQLSEQSILLDQLQSKLYDIEKKMEELSRSAEIYKSENEHLRSIVQAYSDQRQKLFPQLIPIDDKTRKILEGDLSGIHIPPTIANRFAAHRIFTVLDLVRYSERQLAKLEGISDVSIAIIKRMLKRYDLKLGADIRYLPLENEYYIYPQEKTVDYDNSCCYWLRPLVAGIFEYGYE